MGLNSSADSGHLKTNWGTMQDDFEITILKLRFTIYAPTAPLEQLNKSCSHMGE
jgi:hypothetical protein